MRASKLNDLTDDHIERAIALGNRVREGYFRCKLCKTEKSIVEQSKQRPKFCIMCAGE